MNYISIYKQLNRYTIFFLIRIVVLNIKFVSFNNKIYQLHNIDDDIS